MNGKTKLFTEMTAGDICECVRNNIKSIEDTYKEKYVRLITDKNINGRVLTLMNSESPSFDKLQSNLDMTLGDWTLFKSWIISQCMISIQTSQTVNNKGSDMNRYI